MRLLEVPVLPSKSCAIYCGRLRQDSRSIRYIWVTCHWIHARSHISASPLAMMQRRQSAHTFCNVIHRMKKGGTKWPKLRPYECSSLSGGSDSDSDCALRSTACLASPGCLQSQRRHDSDQQMWLEPGNSFPVDLHFLSVVRWRNQIAPAFSTLGLGPPELALVRA